MEQAPMFDLLNFPSLTMEDPSMLRHPFDKNKKLKEKVQERLNAKLKFQKELEQSKKRKLK